MRFIIKNDCLLPSKDRKRHLANLPNSHPSTTILKHEFPLRELQLLLTGKQLLLDDLPFPLEEIQNHYENGYITYRKGIEYDQKSSCLFSVWKQGQKIGLLPFHARGAAKYVPIAANV